MRQTPYLYEIYEINHPSQQGFFDDEGKLISLHGYAVGSKFTFTPQLLEEFKRDFSSFSDDFKNMFSIPIFTVSDFQINSIHPNRGGHGLICMDVEDFDIRQQFNAFCRRHSHLLQDHGYGSNNGFYCFSTDAIVPATVFPALSPITFTPL